MSKAATHNGTCQVCLRSQAITNGLAKHGYEVKGFGFFNGVCGGAHQRPLEQDRSVLDATVVRLIKHAEELEAQAAKGPESIEKISIRIDYNRRHPVYEQFDLEGYIANRVKLYPHLADKRDILIGDFDRIREEVIKGLQRDAVRARKYAADLHIAADATFGRPLQDRSLKAKRADSRVGPFLSYSKAAEAAGPGGKVIRRNWQFYGYKAGA